MMIVNGKNKIVDGDEMVVSLHLDKWTADQWSMTKPSQSAVSQNEPTAYSTDLNLSKPIMSQFYRYFGYDK